MGNIDEKIVLLKVYNKLRKDSQDPQMGLGQFYFEELIIFAYSLGLQEAKE